MNDEHVKNEELVDFLDGHLSRDEVRSLRRRLSAGGEDGLLPHLRLVQKACLEALDAQESSLSIEVPLSAGATSVKTVLVLNPRRLAAAKFDGYLCDIECEEYILLSLGYEVTKKTLLDEAYRNRWMKEEGMPIYHVGRLLEKNHLSVSRRYDSSIDEVVRLLADNNKLIAVVNAAKLTQTVGGGANPNHAVVVLEVRLSEGQVRLFDPQTGNSADTYPLQAFLDAWADSQNFLVQANRHDAFVYEPQPIAVDDVALSPELVELGEAIAENAHEVWASRRNAEGWRWGAERNDQKKEHPDMVPYSDLPETEKGYDRDMAMQTLKLVQKMGYRIVKLGE